MALWHSKRKAFRCGHRGLHTPSIRQSVARICDTLHSWVIGQCRVGRVFRRLSGWAGATCARTPTYRSCDQVRVRHQLGNGEGARHRSSAGASCHRRRGDRVGVSVHPTARFHGLCHRATLSPLLRCTIAVWSGSDSTVRRCGSHVRSTPDCYRMLHRGLRRFEP
jgi:hypothetical protein